MWSPWRVFFILEAVRLDVMSSTAQTLNELYDALMARFGPQDWWPGGTPFEVMVGAVLTQNTNWKNVEKAIENLKRQRLLDPFALHAVPVERLGELIRPSGYYNIKARRLKNLTALLVEEYAGDLQALFSGPLDEVQRRLLRVRGVGLETADSIILYAAERPTFVIDSYTCRVISRHGLVMPGACYEEVKSLFEDNLPRDVRLFNEYHALLVRVAKEYCRKRARCQGCPLEGFPHDVEFEAF